MPSRVPDPAAVRALLEPRSIAVIGASRDPARIGGRPIAYLRQAGFDGPVHPVNPSHREVQGLPAFASVADLPEAPDLAIVALPAKAVPEAIDACGARGVAAAIVFSAGFAETGEEGARVQRRLVENARCRGLRLLGPNCLGAVNVQRGLIATFSVSVQSGLPQPGRIGFVTQSGAFGSHCFALARERGVGISRLITTGNECDLNTADCIAYLAEDADTRVIALHLEGCRDGEQLRTALERARDSGKPVVVLKGGESALGSEAALSHTASLAGSDEAYDALFRRYPVHRARTIAEFIDVAHAASLGILPWGNRLGLITISGGVGILMADAAARHGLEVPPLPEEAQETLKSLWPPAAVRNPVDTTAQPVSDPGLTARFQEVMLERGGYDVLINFFSMLGLAPALAERFRPSLRAVRQSYPDRLLMLSAVCTPEVRRGFEEDGFLVFEDPSSAVQTAAALIGLGRRLEDSRPWPREPEQGSPRLEPDQRPDEPEAMGILAAAGIPVAPGRRARSPEEAVAAATELGFPVVVKVASPDIPHKSDIGGVRLGLATGAEVREAYAQVTAAAASRCPDARVDGILVARMLPAGIEMALGVKNDSTFGPLVMAGLGGVFVEVLRDVAFELAPFGRDEALTMLRRLRGYPLLEGARGGRRADLDSLADALTALSRFACANADRLESVDINPLLVFAEGEGVAAADAVIIPRERHAHSA